MKNAVARGLETEGTLKGGLEVQRKAKMLYRQKHIDESAETRENRLVCAYAYACLLYTSARYGPCCARFCGGAYV